MVSKYGGFKVVVNNKNDNDNKAERMVRKRERRKGCEKETEVGMVSEEGDKGWNDENRLGGR